MSTAISFQHQAPESVAAFSVEESTSYYMLAVDLPTLGGHPEILSDNNELLVKNSEDSGCDSVYFRCRPHGNNIRASYKDGVLWLMLPKTQLAAVM